MTMRITGPILRRLVSERHFDPIRSLRTVGSRNTCVGGATHSGISQTPINTFPNASSFHVLHTAVRTLSSESIKPKMIEQMEQLSPKKPKPDDEETNKPIEQEKFVINYVEINTCGPLYMQKGRGSGPFTGIDFEVGYIDTAPDAPKGTPIVLALHGTPGKNVHFKELLQVLSKENVRVIAPDFPGFGCTKLESSYWRHTPDEKGNFILDFLHALDISRVDVLVSHSSAIYTSLPLSKEVDTIKSLVIVNPGVHKSLPAYKPVWMTSMAVVLARNPLLRPMILSSVSVMTQKRATLDQVDPENLLLSVETLLAARMKEMPELLSSLALRNIPVCLFISANDNLVKTEYSLEMASFLNMKEENFTVIGQAGDVKRIGKKMEPHDRYMEGFLLEFGTHFGMRLYPDLVSKSVMDIISHVRSKM